MREKGVTITKPDATPFRQATESVYEEFYATPAGKDARKMVDLILARQVAPMADEQGGPRRARGRADARWRAPTTRSAMWAALILAIMAGAVFLQVVLRFLGSAGIDGLDEVPRYLFVWLVMIGAAAAMQRGQHTVLDYFVNLLTPRGRALVLIADQRRRHRVSSST